MAYKNIFYDYKTQKIHLWDDVLGYKIINFEDYLYISSENSETKNIYGESVSRITKSFYNTLPEQTKRALKTYERDVRPEIRFLVDNYFESQETPKKFTVLGFDIETEKHKVRGYSSPREGKNKIYSIASKYRKYNNKEKQEKKIVYLLDESKRYKNKNNYDFVKVFSSEISMLKAFLDDMHKIKPDIVTGWNSEYYDIPYVYNRLNEIIGAGFGNNLSPIQECRVVELTDSFFDSEVVHIAGISHLDYMLLYKNYTYGELPSYSLDYVAYKELGIGKIEYKGSLQQLYENDIDKFVEYNIRDVDIIFMIEDKLKFMELCMKIAHGRHVTYEDALHATRVHEGSFLTKCKEKGIVGKNKPEQSLYSNNKIVGAHVKQSKKGLFDWCFDLDLTSLYPSIIITLNISPETKVGRIRNYISVWEEKKKTLFKINYPVFNVEEEYPDPNHIINIEVELDSERKVYKIKTMGDLTSFMKEKNLTLSGNGIFYTKDFVGILPEIMIETFEKRKHYKKLRDQAYADGDTDLAETYDLWQMAYKIDLNSLYGALANKYYRLFDQENAQSITMTGRFIAQTGMNQVIRVHKEFLKSLKGVKMDERMRELFKDPHLTGDTDSVILTAMPYLYYMYGDDYKSMDEDLLIESILDFSKVLAEIVNDRMKVFGDNWLNSDNNWLNYKEEWIARRGFYMGVKKKYANCMIFKEGRKVDKLEVKGMDIIRSTFPKRMQDFMRDFVNMILREDDVELKMKDKIVNFKNELYDLGNENINLISAIASVKKLNDYEIFEFNSYTKGTPYAVKGALNFNLILDRFGMSADYMKIKAGEKIKSLYLKKNPLGISQVSLPFDGDVPPQVEEFVEEFIDIRACVAGLLDNKIKKFYDALSWDTFNANFDINKFYE